MNIIMEFRQTTLTEYLALNVDAWEGQFEWVSKGLEKAKDKGYESVQTS